MTTEVIKVECNYGRPGILSLIDNNVVFDTSDDEYGPVIFDIKILEDKIKEHKEKLNNG